MFQLRSVLLFAACLLGCSPPPAANPAAPGATAAPGAAAPATGATPSAGDPQAAFMAAFRQASETKNLEQMLSLYCWDGVDAEMRDVVRGNVQDELLQPITDLQIVAPEPGKHGPTVEGGIRWRPNLPVVALMKAKFAPGPPGGLSVGAADYALGLQNGRYKIVLSIRDK